MPLIMNFKDGNKKHYRSENIEMLCYNCYFLYHGEVFDEKDLDDIVVDGGSQGEYVPNKKTNDSDFPLIYSADRIDYFLKTETTKLIGNATAKHENTDLKAGFIEVNWPTRILNAFPKQPHDSINQFIKPTIIEKGRDPMVGNKMTYNLDTKKGKINYGKTRADDGFYKGK